MFNRLVLIIAVLLLLTFILDPFKEAIKNSTVNFVHKTFGPDDQQNSDDSDAVNYDTPDEQPDTDSTGILEQIDSIERIKQQ